MHHKTNFLYLFFMISISRHIQRDQINHMEINVIDADVDVGTNATTQVLLLESDLKPVYTYFN